MKDNNFTFSQILLKLQQYWADQGCNVLQPYDIPAGAGTFHPATLLRSLDSKPWSVAYVAPSRRPTDGRYGENPNRLGSYYQFQALIKPSPDNIQELYMSFSMIQKTLLISHDFKAGQEQLISRLANVLELREDLEKKNVSLGDFKGSPEDFSRAQDSVLLEFSLLCFFSHLKRTVSQRLRPPQRMSSTSS